MIEWKQDPHRRYNPLTSEWVLVSPQRTARPWQGQVEKTAAAPQAAYDPECYLCPGNTRAGGVHNPEYDKTFVFENDFAALRPTTSPGRYEQDGILIAEAEPGICRVICFSPRHDLTIATMDLADLRPVIDTWVEQWVDLGSKEFIHYVQIFENRGAMMGASNPHPHCQVWANHSVPNEIAKEAAAQQAWMNHRGSCLLCDYRRLEESIKDRIVEQNESFVTLVPFWAVWPFETMIIARRHVASLDELTNPERDDLAAILKGTTSRYDRLFQTPFPYSMGFHQRPTDRGGHPGWHLHLHFHPPLLRSATVRKFLVGYELLAMPQRDITAESAAERLRAL